jgi:RNA polymerase sigma-70 factor (ECF subfamily)
VDTPVAEFDHSTTLQRLLDLVRAGHPSARNELLAHALDRLRRITRHMFRRQPDLRGPDETDDVLQLALVRLHRALDSVAPDSVAAFFGLASRQIR